jgi:hypothetical protein
MAAQRAFVLPKDIPLDVYPKPEVFLAEGRRIVEEAQRRGAIMRVMGPLALHYHFADRVDLYASLERLGARYFTDIDFAAYGKGRDKVMATMKDLGYECDLNTLMTSGKTRHIYFGGAVPMIDVFFDKLEYCHTIDYAGRLELDPYSVSLTDILLQKLQIWEINDKDLKDIEYLFVCAPFGDDDEAKVNEGFVARRFADDWGFWYTATTNLARVREHVDGVPALSPEHRARVREIADRLDARIEAEPKSKGWAKRAKKGTAKPWFNQGFSDW